MKAPLILCLTLCTFPTRLIAGDVDEAKDGDIVKYYEIDFAFFNALYTRWLDQNKIDPEETEVLPRVKPRALAEAIDILVEKDQVFQHNIILGRHILTVSIHAEDHEKLKSAYREILKEEIPTISAADLEELVKRHQDATTDIDDPIAQPKSEKGDDSDPIPR